ncbi:DNA-binding protein [Dichotomocladium elegans]|nr:DNA-binding protein [Dichotomocladium elegans]
MVTTRRDIVNVLCDFLEVWIQRILYLRNLYPKEIFELRKKYDVPVYMATHPDVAKYVSQFVRSVHPLLLKGTCKSVALVVHFKSQTLERFVFETDSILYEVLEDADISTERLFSSESKMPLADLQQHLRACLLRIEACVASMSDIPPESTFTLTLETQHEPLDHDEQQQQQQWIPASSATEGLSGAGGHVRWEGMIPIKTIPMDIYRINMFVLEAVKKGKYASK